ncbi:DUF3159 domain-containing protein [Frankia tisae]|uniref:DUF3159 domain-containing protein n=2 Tax=Frankia tisae TaxID=2950104 RepID=UPI0021BEA7AF|nr:DUF3159 domain-containing protein [Frankia tisae]
MSDTAAVQLPRPRSIAKHAVPHLVEATVIPAALFLIFLHLGGLTLAALIAVAWGYIALGRRVVRRQRIPAMLILSSVGLTVRTVIVIINGNAFIYFLQPVIVAAVIGLIFLLSALTPRPLVHRLAGDFCPLPPGVTERTGVRRLFLGLTLFWAVVNLGNAAFTFWLLVSQSTAVFVAIRGVTGMTVTATAVAITVAWSWRVARLEGLRGPSPRPSLA